MSNSLILQAATLLLFVSTLITTISASTAVLDIDGHPLRTDSNYYILPVFRGRGGGLTMESENATQSCPLVYVAQEPLEVSNGLPVKFYPVNPKLKTIPVSTDLNFVFDVFTICIQSTVWNYSTPYLGIGGVIGNPGPQTLSNWFAIEKAGSGKYDYKIVFCPSVCAFCRVRCGDVGVFVQKDGRRLLGLSVQPLLVNFKKSLERVGKLQDA